MLYYICKPTNKAFAKIINNCKITSNSWNLEQDKSKCQLFHNISLCFARAHQAITIISDTNMAEFLISETVNL